VVKIYVLYPVPAAGTRSGGLPVPAAGTGYPLCIRSRQPGLDLGAFQSRQPGLDTLYVSGPGSRDSIWGPSSPGSRDRIPSMYPVPAAGTLSEGLPVPAAGTKYQYPTLPKSTKHTPQAFYGPFPGPPGEPVPEENFCTLWCKGITDTAH